MNSPSPRRRPARLGTAVSADVPAGSVPASQSAEDYLERIHELIETKGYARPIEIAEALKIRQSSVTRMMQRLHDLGYANYEKHRGLTLTPAGIKVAQAIRRRHQFFEEFFKMIGVSEKSILRDIEGVEHHISGPTMRRLESFIVFLRENPDVLEQFRSWVSRNKSAEGA